MTLNVDLPPNVERAYLAEAQARGVSLDTLIRDVLLTRQPVLPAADMPPEQRAAAFEAWSASHRPTPPLSDHAVSRDGHVRGSR